MLLPPLLPWLSLFLLWSDSPTLALSLSDAPKSAVIVGGGPVGLATALTLSNPPHSYDVTVLEQASVEQYDPTKAYLYNVNPRGQVWMKEHFPGALAKLQARGSQGSMSRITIVPADPQTPIPQIKTLDRYDTTKNNPQQDGEAEEAEVEQSSSVALKDDKVDTRNYWIPRHSMICLLEDEIKEQEAARMASSTKQVGAIHLKKDRKFASLTPSEDGTVKVAVQEVTTGETETYSGSLIVAADGFNSAVRDCLADDKQTSWLQTKPAQFRVKRWKSPASGLRMKVIQMPPGFGIPDSDGTLKTTENEYTYAIRPTFTGFNNFVSLGLLPVKDPSMIRPANVITRPDHDIWTKVTDGPTAKAWFSEAYPRFHWDDYVDDAEWDRFAKAAGTTFPYCQYSPGLQVTGPQQTSGVALVGDAAHAFPPDIGQGINAGLCDVVALDRALRGKDIITGKEGETPANLGAALKEYERVQGPQIRSLIRISRFGFPYQYRQSWFRDRVGRLLLTSNIAFRMLLNKLSFGKIPPSCIVLLQNSQLTYRQVMRRADLTTAAFCVVLLAFLWAKFGMMLMNIIGLAI
ncbi:Kynurenine 3-monooxygenase [Seminavis robusta]|uniref:Kynurenine 3-monooxygenase n=1 Tax=Seminavis robusta TaxID=568900 RepID=A0A9N8EAT4_9STRA|nr:Kynurenine 3-monooxygenase [Seminavis robusta]|eukprot:Sro874_g214210.1 Kynurenine 3-monooxygenase (576) ;mRNA; r:19890-21863